MIRGRGALIAIAAAASVLAAGGYLGAGLLVARGTVAGTERVVATIVRDLDGASTQTDRLNGAFQLPADLRNAQDAARARQTIDAWRSGLDTPRPPSRPTSAGWRAPMPNWVPRPAVPS